MKILSLTSIFGNRVIVKFDSAISLTIPLDTAVQFFLKPKLELTAEQYLSLKQTAQTQSLWNQTLKWATLRPRSVAELNHYAKDKLNDDQLQSFTQKLKDLNFLSDERFSTWWVENRQAFRPKSQLELQQELKRKGISADNRLTALSQSDESTACLQVAQKYAKKLSRFSDFEKKHKLYAYLIRRGFSSSHIKSAISQLLSTDRSD